MKNPIFPWIVLFIFLNLLVTQTGEKNALSRLAGLRAITEGHTLNIDNYKDWTIDWSLSPNGKIYSNKAPGGVLLGLPVFALTEIVAKGIFRGQLDTFGRRPEPAYWQVTLLVFFTQILPFAWLVLLATKQMATRGASLSSQHFFALAALFGNTAAIYMNCYFGHGLAALWLLAFCYFWVDRRYALAACAFAFAMLTDYAGIMLLPALFLALLLREKSWRVYGAVALGALPGALLWIFYHKAAFGSPFAIASQYINPEQVEEVRNQASGLRGFSFLPSGAAVRELLIGPSRGILFTQPWVLLAIAWSSFGIFALRTREHRALSSFLCVGFLGVLWMNAGTSSWNGGWCAGPRYLCFLFPAFAFIASYHLDSISKPSRTLFWLGLIFALVFRALIFPHPNLAPGVPLWNYYASLYLQGHRGTSFLRLGLLCMASLACGIWVHKRQGVS